MDLYIIEGKCILWNFEYWITTLGELQHSILQVSPSHFCSSSIAQQNISLLSSQDSLMEEV